MLTATTNTRDLSHRGTGPSPFARFPKTDWGKAAVLWQLPYMTLSPENVSLAE